VEVLKARLTVECHKLLNDLLNFKHTTHESSRTTLAPSSLFRVSKILIYVNTDYHKLHNATGNLLFRGPDVKYLIESGIIMALCHKI